ncbi:MAG: AAA family ATPase [Terracidiphilus sp.]
MKIIHFLRGLPASGKTTWALAKLNQVNNETGNAAVRVNKDEIRTLIGATDGSREGEVARYQLCLVTKAAKEGVDIIIDDTNLYVGNERRFRKLAERFGYRFEVHSFLHVSVDECIRRDRIREQPVGEAVIVKLFEKYVARCEPQPNWKLGSLLMFPRNTDRDK